MKNKLYFYDEMNGELYVSFEPITAEELNADDENYKHYFKEISEKQYNKIMAN